MRILIASQFYPPIIGGEENHVRNLGQALARRGHDVSVATLQCSGSDARDMDGAVQIHRLQGALQRVSGLFKERERRHTPPFPDPELVARLNGVLKEVRPHVIHAHNWILHSFLPLKRRAGPKLVVTLHDLSLVCSRKSLMNRDRVCDGPGLIKCIPCASRQYGAYKGPVTAGLHRISSTYERAIVDRFVAVSREVAKLNRLERSRAPYEVIPNFVPDDVGQIASEAPACVYELPEEAFILFVGDLTRLKGVEVLLKAYGVLEAAPPLVLIGREHPDTPRHLPPGSRLFKSWPHAAVMHAWRRCLFGVVPSVLPEACATTVMEAMSQGKPVIASDIGGTPDLLDHDDTGLLVAPGDVGALAGAMRALLEDPPRRARMGAAGLRKVETLKAGSVVPRIERVYRDVAGDVVDVGA